ncbi:MAG: O-antigen ligase family protein [Nonlabens sp.]
MSLIKNKILLNLPLYLVYALCLGILLPPFIRNITIILTVTVSLFLFVKDSERSINVPFLLLNAGIFLTYSISLLYTHNLEIGFKKLETALSLFAFPLIFAFLPQSIIQNLKSKLNVILMLLIASGVGLVFISFFIDLINHGLEAKFSSYVSRLQYTKTIYGIDNMYRSFHIGIALLSSFVLLYRYSNFLKWLYALVLILISSTLLLIISSKVMVAASFISLFAFAFLANTKKVIFALALICGVLLTIAIYSPNLNNKITNLFTIKNERHANITQQEVRGNLTHCTGKLLPEAGFFGFGIGDAKKKLVDCYNQIDSDLGDLKFNTHNQYFSIVLISGFLGLLVFIVFLLVNLVRSLNYKNYAAVVFIIFFSIVMFSENILERHNGVIAFAFILSLLLSLNLNNRNNKKVKSKVFFEATGHNI